MPSNHEGAGVADFSIACPAPDLRDIVVWQTAVGQFLADENAKGLLIHDRNIPAAEAGPSLALGPTGNY